MILPYRGKGNLLVNGRLRGEEPPCFLACTFRHGDQLCAPARLWWAGAATTSVKAMEMNRGPRPVYGGPGRMKLKKLPLNDTVRGVQGSCGPLVGVHRIETVGPLVLSVTKEQR